jgi:hypothetical protein
MELGTIVAGIIALRYFAFPFLTAPIFFSAWFLTMDLIPVLFGKDLSWEKGQWVSLFFGLVLISISYVIDRKKLRDYAFWGYFFGTLAFWGSMTSLIWNKGEFVLFLYFVVNFLLMGLSIVLRRKVFMVFGALGCFIYLSHLAYAIFQNSILFPFVLSIIGLGIVYLGIYYQKNVERIEGAIASIIPEGIRAFFFLD